MPGITESLSCMQQIPNGSMETETILFRLKGRKKRWSLFTLSASHKAACCETHPGGRSLQEIASQVSFNNYTFKIDKEGLKHLRNFYVTTLKFLSVVEWPCIIIEIITTLTIKNNIYQMFTIARYCAYAILFNPFKRKSCFKVGPNL